MSAQDLTLYNQFKTRLARRPGQLGIISLVGDGGVVEIRYFKLSERTLFSAACDRCIGERASYAVVVEVDGDFIFDFACREFQMTENLTTGQITEFGLDPYHLEFKKNETVLRRELKLLFAVLARDS